MRVVIALCGLLAATNSLDSWKQTILNQHNALRTKINNGQVQCKGAMCPTPNSNLSPLKWDEGLANLAQDWANQCDWGHEDYEVRRQRFQRVRGTNSNVPSGQGAGENIAAGGSPRSSAAQMWGEDESKYWTYNTKGGVCTSGKMCGHFTQMVWANTQYVGCGYKQGCGFANEYLVCNYYPPGNYQGQSPYIGSSSSSGSSSSEPSCLEVSFPRQLSRYAGEYTADGTKNGKKKYKKSGSSYYLFYVGNNKWAIDSSWYMNRNLAYSQYTLKCDEGADVTKCKFDYLTSSRYRDQGGVSENCAMRNGEISLDGSANESNNGNGMSEGWKIALIVVGICSLLMAAVGSVLFMRQRKDKSMKHADIVLDEAEVEKQERETADIEMEMEMETDAIA